MTSWLAFIVHDHAAKVVEPGESAFHDPALGNRHEAAPGCWRTTRELMLPPQRLYLLHKTSLIGLVSQYAM